MDRDDKRKEAWSKKTYSEFMAVCEKYQLTNDELCEYADRMKKNKGDM